MELEIKKDIKALSDCASNKFWPRSCE